MELNENQIMEPIVSFLSHSSYLKDHQVSFHTVLSKIKISKALFDKSLHKVLGGNGFRLFLQAHLGYGGPYLISICY